MKNIIFLFFNTIIFKTYISSEYNSDVAAVLTDDKLTLACSISINTIIAGAVLQRLLALVMLDWASILMVLVVVTFRTKGCFTAPNLDFRITKKRVRRHDIEKICYKNVCRVWINVDKVANKLQKQN